jgi:glycosyltransferase involved in cell wall biosynthesis
MGKFIEDFNDTGKRAKVIIFSGIENTSYTGKTGYEQLIQGIYDVLDDDGVLIHAGNLGWADNDYGQYFHKLFENVEGDGHDKTYCFVYKKKSVK